MRDRTSVLVDTGDLSAPVGSLAWTTAVHFEAKGVLNDNESSRKLVEQWVGGLHKDNHFQCLKDSKGRNYLLWSAFCKDRQPWGLGYSEEAINAILRERGDRDAVTNQEKAQQAAQETTGEVLPKGNPTGNNQHKRKEEIAKCANSSPRQADRAATNGISHYTQRKLDRLARDFPEHHQRVASGTLSVNRACIEVGIAKRTVPLALEPQDAARTILRHFQRDAVLELVRVLANHAGGKFVEPEETRP